MALLIAAQAPVLVGYQAVVRDVSGVLIKNTVVSVRISILFQSVQGTPLYI
ncbi:MAG: hypothetical protein H7329_13915 [Opitutaceae bacterium]|nr:hypothetical protein [Cytophagales bacterium]